VDEFHDDVVVRSRLDVSDRATRLKSNRTEPAWKNRFSRIIQFAVIATNDFVARWQKFVAEAKAHLLPSHPVQ